MCSVLYVSVIPWTLACQAALSIEFSRQEYRSVLLFPTLGDLSDPGIQLTSPVSLALEGEFFTNEPPGKLNEQLYANKLESPEAMYTFLETYSIGN